MFDESKINGFKNETTDTEDDLPFKISFDQENLELKNQNTVEAEIKEESPFKTLVTIENLASEESSSGDENEH